MVKRPLGRYVKVFKALVYVTIYSVTEISERSYKNNMITIDSQAILRTLVNPNTSQSKLIWVYIREL